MAINPTEITALLIADSPTDGSVPVPTQVGNVNVSAVVECQSTTRAFLLPRMTTVQRDAIVTPTNGMMIYNTTTNTANSYENGAWGASGGGDVDGPANSTNQGLSIFSGVTGKLLAATTVLLNPATSVISAVGGLISAAGTAAAPTYSITGDTDTGIYSSGANTLDIATAGVRQFSVTGAATSVNFVSMAGAATGSGPTITASGTDPNADLVLSSKNNGNVIAKGGLVLNSTNGVAPAGNVNQTYLSVGSAGGGLGSTLAITGSAASGPVTVVNPTAPNRTIAIVVNGTTYYLAAKTTND